jgi:hypothetical protein
MSKMIEFLLDLAADPDRCARFKVDTASELEHADLSDWEKAAVATRDPATISAAMNDSTPDADSVLRWLAGLLEEPGD